MRGFSLRMSSSQISKLNVCVLHRSFEQIFYNYEVDMTWSGEPLSRLRCSLQVHHTFERVVKIMEVVTSQFLLQVTVSLANQMPI